MIEEMTGIYIVYESSSGYVIGLLETGVVGLALNTGIL